MGSLSAAMVVSSSEAVFSSGIVATNMPRVLLDARKLGDGGIGVYIENLIAGLIDTKEVRLSIITKPGAEEALMLPENVEVIHDSARSYSFDEMFGLPRRIDFSLYDVFHEPHYTLPYGIPIPTVVTVHDLIHLRHPEKAFIPYLARFLINSALKRADRVLTVSRASCQQLSELARGRETVISKLRVVPNALDPFFLERETEPVEAPHKRSCGRYLLSILSNLKPHKGVSDLLMAFRIVKEHFESLNGEKSSRPVQSVSDLKLVLLGAGTQAIVDREQLLELASLVKGVKIVGRVSKEDLKSWYQGAQALVVPSKEEGFCLPVIEAQAVGTPVIARPVPAVRDILSDKDMLSPDFSVDSLAATIIKFLSSERPPRDPAYFRPPAHLDAFSRDKLARQVVSVYREALFN